MLKKSESVWDYPRPPALEHYQGHIRVIHGDIMLANSNKAVRILETSHPPTYYIPPQDIDLRYLHANSRSSFCEWKGKAHYYDLIIDDVTISDVAWAYAEPNHDYAHLKDCLCFYASRVDACYVDGERVKAQEGDFYGGWITANVTGPFKGGAGTLGW